MEAGRDRRGEGVAQRSERFLQARVRTELRAPRTLLAACVPALMRGNAATPLIAGDHGRRPLVCRAAVYPGSRNLVGAERRRLLMFTKRGTCDSGVRRRTRSASTRGGPVAREARGLRMGYAMMGEGRRAANRARAVRRLRVGQPPRPGNAPKQLLSPDLCASDGAPLPRLPPPCACVYSSPSRRTPVDAAARTPRTGYCGRRRRSDRPFRTGFIRWLENGETLSQAPVFHEFLESIHFFQL